MKPPNAIDPSITKWSGADHLNATLSHKLNFGTTPAPGFIVARYQDKRDAIKLKLHLTKSQQWTI
jgi:hypothetical protein